MNKYSDLKFTVFNHGIPRSEWTQKEKDKHRKWVRQCWTDRINEKSHQRFLIDQKVWLEETQAQRRRIMEEYGLDGSEQQVIGSKQWWDYLP